MRLTSDAMQLLMAYADGELEGEDIVEVERLLATEPDAVRFVEQVGGLGDRVRDAFEGTGNGVDVADAVMAKVMASPPADVVSLDAARRAKTPPNKATGRGALAKWGLGGAVAFAAAAAVVLFMRPEETPLARGEAAAVVPIPGIGIEVSGIETTGRTVSVLYLPGKNELSTSVVVWVDETGEK